MVRDMYQSGHHYDAVFGPTCETEAEIVSRLMTGWETMQFGFWKDARVELDSNHMVLTSVKSGLNLGENMASVMKVLDWYKVSIVSCSLCFDTMVKKFGPDEGISPTVAEVKEVFARAGVEVRYEYDLTPDQMNPVALDRILENVYNHARIVVPILGENLRAYSTFMQAMFNKAMTKESFGVVIGVQTVEPATIPWMVNGRVDPNIYQWFDQALIVYNSYFVENAARVQQWASEMGVTGTSEQTGLRLRLHESLFAYAHALEKSFARLGQSANYKNATAVRPNLLNANISGPITNMIFDQFGHRLYPYQVLMASNATDHQASATNLVPIIRLAIFTDCADEEEELDEPTSTSGAASTAMCFKLDADFVSEHRDLLNLLPPDMPSCGYRGEECDQRGTILIIIAVMTAICFAFMVFLCVRRMRSGETAQMPWAIPAASIHFLDIEYNRLAAKKFEDLDVHSVTSARLDNRNPFESSEDGVFAGRYRHVGTIEQAFVIVEAYKLKEKIMFDKRDMHMLFQMKQAIHDNINSFIGLSLDKGSDFYVVWKHCLRGTLTDVITNSNAGNLPKFDRDFKSAFVRDIIRGLDFIHSSAIGYHGGLTATQCLIDSHWILKISGFGLPRMLHRWKNTGMLACRNNAPMIPNSELHYYAPEVRKAIKQAVQRNKPEDLEFPSKDGQAQDMYAFGCILYEIVFLRRFVELEDVVDANPDAEDELGIFSELAEERLPFYPSFPDDVETHPDLLSLMHKCFNGKPELRPDANMCRKITDATLKTPGSLVDQMMKNTENYTNNLENLVSERTGQLETEQKRSDELLQELLPKSVITELKLGKTVAPKLYKCATIMYSDIVGFTSLCSESQPMEVVSLLNGMFTAFDNVIGQHKCYKVETIGDAYMVASGVPDKLRNEHVREIAYTALKQRQIPHRPGQRLHCRWGFNSGSVFTGVVGVTAPRYCVFGGTVTLAAKMENSGQPDRIQMTLKSQQLLTERYPEFRTSPRGGIRIEGVGTLLTYWLESYDEELASGRAPSEASVADEDEETENIPDHIRANDLGQ